MGSRLQKKKKIFKSICILVGNNIGTKTRMTEYFYIEHEQMCFVYKNSITTVLNIDELIWLSKTAAVKLIMSRVTNIKEKFLLNEL